MLLTGIDIIEIHRIKDVYKKYPEIGGIAHTHSKFATAWSQAKKSIPILGTTHADYSQKNIQVTNPLKKNQIIKNYEKTDTNFKEQGLIASLDNFKSSSFSNNIFFDSIFFKKEF